MDTVEWGAGEPAARRVPALRLAVPGLGGMALAVAGFGLLVAAEIVPWAAVQNTAANTARTATFGGTELSVGLDRITAGSGFTYHLGLIVLLAAVGFVLTCPPARRRVAMGIAVGVAAGQVLMILAVTRSALRTFDTLSALNPTRSGPGLNLQVDTGFRVVLGEGVYLASAAVLVLAAAAVTGGLLRRGTVAEPEPAAVATPSGAATAAPPRRPRRPDPVPAQRADERELTVTPLEPMDESYFARE